MEIPVQVNGKVKATVSVLREASKEEVLAAAKAAIEGKVSGNIVKEIYVPGRIVNIVAK